MIVVRWPANNPRSDGCWMPFFWFFFWDLSRSIAGSKKELAEGTTNK
jgi:hypothetical protein